MVEMPRPFDKSNPMCRLYQYETVFYCNSLKIILTTKAVEYVHTARVLHLQVEE
jgi:hypothetical protein